jgi:hypothetical protein
MPTVPVAVWEQIGVVVVFAFLLAGLGWLLVRIFTGVVASISKEHTQAISEINSHYSGLIKESNSQWQLYFDARSRATELIDGQIVVQLKSLTEAISELSERHDKHDTMVRNALDGMAEKRKKLTVPK